MTDKIKVAIHNKNGQGLLRGKLDPWNNDFIMVAIHNKNGQGLLPSWNTNRSIRAAVGRNPQ